MTEPQGGHVPEEQTDLHPLSVLLDAGDCQQLVAAKLDPNNYTTIELDAENIQVSQVLPNGSYMLQMQVRTPPKMFTEPSKILAPNGVPARALDGVIGLNPKVRCVVAIDKMTDKARTSYQKAVSERVDAMGVEHA